MEAPALGGLRPGVGRAARRTRRRTPRRPDALARDRPRAPRRPRDGGCGSNVHPLIYYAGSADGGVWKSVDGGTSWQNVSDLIHLSSVGADRRRRQRR